MTDNSKKTQTKGRGSHPNSKANLIPIKKGRSGNPAGPKPGYKQRGTLLREVVDTIASFQNPITKKKERMPVELKLEYAIIEKAMRGDVRAYQEVKDSIYGKIADKVESDVTQQILVEFVKRDDNSDKGNSDQG